MGHSSAIAVPPSSVGNIRLYLFYFFCSGMCSHDIIISFISNVEDQNIQVQIKKRVEDKQLMTD